MKQYLIVGAVLSVAACVSGVSKGPVDPMQRMTCDFVPTTAFQPGKIYRVDGKERFFVTKIEMDENQMARSEYANTAYESGFEFSLFESVKGLLKEGVDVTGLASGIDVEIKRTFENGKRIEVPDAQFNKVLEWFTVEAGSGSLVEGNEYVAIRDIQTAMTVHYRFMRGAGFSVDIQEKLKIFGAKGVPITAVGSQSFEVGPQTFDQQYTVCYQPVRLEFSRKKGMGETPVEAIELAKEERKDFATGEFVGE